MKKFFISEDEKKNILKLHNLIKEDYDDKNNSDPYQVSEKRKQRIQKRILRIQNKIDKLNNWLKGRERALSLPEDNLQRAQYENKLEKRNNLISRKRKWQSTINDYTVKDDPNDTDYEMYSGQVMQGSDYDKMSDEEKEKLKIDKDVKFEKEKTPIKQDDTPAKIRCYPDYPDYACPDWGKTSWELRPF